MKVGVIVPQGWTGEYDGWDPSRAWDRTVAVARQAEGLGFESVWLFDHFTTTPRPADELTFESFTALAALAALTERVRLGHIVICNGFRNPALTAKMISTMDVISGGRMELGIGAGWKRDEWLAYGYGFPETKARLAALGDALEVITRMVVPGREARATFAGEHAGVSGAINQPKPLQRPRIPIIVGGNGRRVTLGIAVEFADELNLVFLTPERLAEALPNIRTRCEEEGRDPATLKVSLYTRDEDVRVPGQARVDLLGTLQDLGLSRAVCFPGRWSTELDVQARFAEDCRAAGLEMAEAAASGAKR